MLDFKIDSKEIDNIKIATDLEKNFRVKNLNRFNETGFPNKKEEDWKFSDLRMIISQNFKKFDFSSTKTETKKVNIIDDFEHNSVTLINGKLVSSNFKYEEESKISIRDFEIKDYSFSTEQNSLIHLNHALSNQGYSLTVDDNYKAKKVIVIYNLFSSELNENFLNIKNRIMLGKNSELHLIELVINESKKPFFCNIYEDLKLDNSSKLKSIYLQNNKNYGYFHKFSENNINEKSNLSLYFFPSGPKFCKFDLKFNLHGKNSECNLQAATFLGEKDHHEIKTRVNHLFSDCKSYQRVKKVVNTNGKGIYQGKIFVKDIAQKTDAYQLSKAILIDKDSEFNSKPELEIYADDVKCSHGSTSGNIDEDSIYYLMSRGLSRDESIELLVDGFLNEISETIKSETIRNFVNKKLKTQIK